MEHTVGFNPQSMLSPISCCPMDFLHQWRKEDKLADPVSKSFPQQRELTQDSYSRGNPMPQPWAAFPPTPILRRLEAWLQGWLFYYTGRQPFLAAGQNNLHWVRGRQELGLCSLPLRWQMENSQRLSLWGQGKSTQMAHPAAKHH